MPAKEQRFTVIDDTIHFHDNGRDLEGIACEYEKAGFGIVRPCPFLPMAKSKQEIEYSRQLRNR